MLEKDNVEVNKVHERARIETQLNHDISVKSIMSGNDLASACGLRQTGTLNVSLNNATLRSEKNHHAFDLLLYLATIDELNTRLRAILDKAQESLERINHMQKLKEAWDFEQARLFFSENYQLDISAMSESAARELLATTMDQETVNYARYMQEARNIEHQMNAKLNDPDFLAASPERQQLYQQRLMNAGLSRMAELNRKAEVLGINVEEAGNRLRVGNNGNSNLYEETHTMIKNDEYQVLSEQNLRTTSAADNLENSPFDQLSGVLTNTFEAAAKGQTTEQLARTNDIPLSKIPMKLGGS